MTDKQIEAAAEAMRLSFKLAKQEAAFVDMARAAYPHLAQWEPATEAECGRFANTFDSVQRLHEKSPQATMVATNEALQGFLALRNAALPKPVDPRREKILSVIRSLPSIRFNVGDEEILARNILAALEEV